MCIIVAVPANTPLPNSEVLRECFMSNPDGAGFMWADGKRVQIRKGFMTWKAFEEALNSELDAGNIMSESAVVLHFRITTSGKTQPKCCHPFPVSSEPLDLQALHIDARFGIAHNGIIHGMTTRDGWSDTMDFVAGVVAPLARMNPGFMHSSDALDMLKGACKSKLAILDNSGDLALVGDFVEDDGVFYSNTTYLPIRSNWSSYQGFWEKSLYEEWDDLDELMADLRFAACQLCPLAEDCARFGEECGSEAESVTMCADYSGMDVWDVADCVGASMSEVMAEAGVSQTALAL